MRLPGPAPEHGLRRVPDAVLHAAIRDAGSTNPLLGIGTGIGGLPAHRLCTPADDQHPNSASELVDAVARWLAHPERRVAASLAVLGYAARLVGPTLAILLHHDILLDARPGQVRYTYTPDRGFTLDLPHPTGWHTPANQQTQRWCGTVVDEHLTPFIHAVRGACPVSAGLLWGNVASGITGALRALAEPSPTRLTRCHQTGQAILNHGPLRGSGQLQVRDHGIWFRRRSCCLYYRLPGAGTCGDCPLPNPPHVPPGGAA